MSYIELLSGPIKKTEGRGKAITIACVVLGAVTNISNQVNMHVYCLSARFVSPSLNCLVMGVLFRSFFL